MTVHTVELLPDPRLDRSVRALWGRLRDAGLRSLATHTHPTNRPHLTLTGAASLTGLPPLGLPLPIVLGEARLLGRTLVRQVLPSPELRDLHARVWAAVGSENPLHAPETWTPHISLALNVPAAERAAALALLSGLGEEAGSLDGARTYDSTTRRVAGLG